MKVTVFGAGYVGLVTAACLAHMQHQVICADISKEKIATLASGGLPVWEQGLEALLKEARDAERIEYTTNLTEAILASDLWILAVGTPTHLNGEADLTQIWSVVDLIAATCLTHPLQNTKLLIVKSTVPVGTCDAIESRLVAQNLKDIEIVHNPEFLRQGSAVADFLQPDRIVIGCASSRARVEMTLLYGEMLHKLHFCDLRSAELIKYASNAFLAMKISYINMVAELSEKLDANIEEVARGMGADLRIGGSFLQAGIGYGGSCFPKDLRALKAMGAQVGCDLPLIDATESINKNLPFRLIRKLKEQLGSLFGKRIAILGLAFKPMTDDIREAPSLAFSKLCLIAGAELVAYDPVVRHYPLSQVKLMSTPYKAMIGCDAVVFLTEWDVFHKLDWEQISGRLNTPLILDGRNMFSLHSMKEITVEYGLTYLSMGRPALHSITKPKKFIP